MSKIFISHSNTDKGLHNALRDALIDIGYDMVGLESLSVGGNLSKALNAILGSADAAVAILTENSINSKN